LNLEFNPKVFSGDGGVLMGARYNLISKKIGLYGGLVLLFSFFLVGCVTGAKNRIPYEITKTCQEGSESDCGKKYTYDTSEYHYCVAKKRKECRDEWRSTQKIDSIGSWISSYPTEGQSAGWSTTPDRTMFMSMQTMHLNK
jgi:hypothetical protein